MTTTTDKLGLLKTAGEDFEWYPTTDEMIAAIFKHCGELGSMLDIGAGDGRVLAGIDNLQFERLKKDRGWDSFVSTVDKFAIEKSEIHISNMPPDISIVGTVFFVQTLIDKKVDAVFCNPPYSQYEEWATKIIKEANCNHLFLVLPARWKNSAMIKSVLEIRGLNYQTIWSGDFLEADRVARAKVDIIKIRINQEHNRYGEDPETKGAFDVWFDEYFSGFQPLNHLQDAEDETRRESNRRVNLGELVEGQNLIERLCNLYDNEMKTLLGNYITLSGLDKELLHELGVKVPEIKKGLQSKIDGLKNKYWKELFERFGPITDKLTSKSREQILGKLHKSCNVDFSWQNAYAIAIWAIKNANEYINNQVCEMFKDLSEPESVKNYKSNQRTWEKDGWRYKNEHKHTHYVLDYRIVTVRHSAIYSGDGFGKYNYHNELSNSCHDFLNDILTIANNLGFFNGDSAKNRQWGSGVSQDFYATDGKTLFNVRAYKNGNVHFKFNQDFIKALNIEASRLLGWIKSPEEAATEMGIDLEFARSKFNSNLLIGASEGRKMLCA